MEPFGLIETLFPIFFIAVFSIIVFAFVFVFYRIIKEQAYNKSQPQLTVDVKVIGKRMDVSHSVDHANDSMSHSSTSTYYYISFEVESKDRIEFLIPSYEYGLIVEGDLGRLTFKGRKFISFERR